MNYKTLIIKMLDELEELQLRKIYFFIRGMLGLR